MSKRDKVVGMWGQKIRLLNFKLDIQGAIREELLTLSGTWSENLCGAEVALGIFNSAGAQRFPGLAGGITYPDWLWDARWVSLDKMEIIVSEKEKPPD